MNWEAAVNAFREYLRTKIKQDYKEYLVINKVYKDTKIAGNTSCFVNLSSDGGFFKLRVYGPVTLCDSTNYANLSQEMAQLGHVTVRQYTSQKRKHNNGNILDITFSTIKYAELDADNDDEKKAFMKKCLIYVFDAFKEEMKPGKGGGQRKRNSHKVSECPYNLIVFGAPGTGKSKRLEKLRNEAWRVKKDGEGEEIVSSSKPIDGATRAFDEDKYERVTFYPTYSYAQFVGTYKPVMDDKNQIAYRFVPGPFLNLLVKALKDPEHNYLLIIEEINRANAAAVFGDMFQLLDRDDDGMSEYAIAVPEDVKKWLDSQKVMASHVDGQDALDGVVAWDGVKLCIPENFYIWATMNSADQGVFPLDTAFKRRWEFEYIGVDGKGPNIWIKTDSGAYGWDDLRQAINAKLLSAGKVNEDKLLGPWFLKGKDGDYISSRKFASKVLMYLWEDAARMCRKQFFADGVNMFSELEKKWKSANGLPGEEGSTFSEVFQIQKVNKLVFKERISEKDLENDLKIVQKKNEDGTPAVKDNKPVLEVTYKENLLDDKKFKIESVEGSPSLVEITFENDAPCYGNIRFTVEKGKLEMSQNAIGTEQVPVAAATLETPEETEKKDEEAKPDEVM